MVDYIISASPTVVDLGRRDLSDTPVTPESIPVPSHCPKFYLFAKKGPTTPQLVGGSSASQLYGASTFDEGSDFFNHQTAYAKLALGNGNSSVVERIVPDDAAQSSIVVWAEIANLNITIYQRDPITGKVVLDVNGDPVPVDDPGNPGNPLTVDGYKVRFETTHHQATGSAPDVDTKFGSLTPRVGSLVDINGSTVNLVPIVEFKASSKGVYGNLSGVRLYPAKTNQYPSTLTSTDKLFPFFISLIKKATLSSSTEVEENIYGERESLFCFTKGATSSSTTQELDLGSIFNGLFNNTDDVTLPMKYGDIDTIHVYYDNIKNIQSAIFTKETAFLESPPAGVTAPYSWYDFDNSDLENIPAINFLTGVSTSEVPYFTFELSTSTSGIFFNKYKDLYLDNGADGTLTDTVFNEKVGLKFDEYLDPDSRVQDNAINVESAFWDSGFPLDVKKKMAYGIAVRKNTFLFYTTHIAGEVPNSVSASLAVANALMSNLALYPDSTYFGTEAFRASVLMQTALIRNGAYTERVGMNYELLDKVSKRMGASSGIWDSNERFSSYPGNVVEDLYDVQPEFIPASTKYTLWDTSLVWAQPYDLSSYFFPAQQSAYGSDNSVLNNLELGLLVCELDKIGWRAWRNFSGVVSLTNDQLRERVIDFVNNAVNGRFDDYYTIIPDVYFSGRNNYSWTLNIKVGSNYMKTVQTLEIELYSNETLAG